MIRARLDERHDEGVHKTRREREERVKRAESSHDDSSYKEESSMSTLTSAFTCTCTNLDERSDVLSEGLVCHDCARIPHNRAVVFEQPVLKKLPTNNISR